MMPDDHDDPLEARLHALRPTGLPPGLRDRLLAIEPPPVRHRSLRFAPLIGSLACTVALLWMIALATTPPGHPTVQTLAAKPSTTPETASSADRVFVPASQRSTLLGVSEGETVDADSGHPVRLVRAVWLDDTTYVGADQSTLHRRTTRTEVVPVALENL